MLSERALRMMRSWQEDRARNESRTVRLEVDEKGVSIHFVREVGQERKRVSKLVSWIELSSAFCDLFEPRVEEIIRLLDNSDQLRSRGNTMSPEEVAKVPSHQKPKLASLAGDDPATPEELSLTNEVFALRDGENITVKVDQPTEGVWIAVMLRPVQMPDGPRQEVRPADGAPVEQCAVLACERIGERWQWLQLSPPTKEMIGDLLFDSGFPLNRWFYLVITRPNR